MSSNPPRPPLGLDLARTAKAVSRAFDDALSAAGGSLPTWLVLLSLKSRRWSTQAELANAVGIEGATLTHHLNRLEREGLVTRGRDPENRRVHRVELTDEGDAAFHRLRRAAQRFDRELREGLDQPEVERLSGLLARLRANIDGTGA